MSLRLALALLLVPASASAQFVTSGPDRDAPAGDNVDETAYRGRITTTGFYYGESSDGTVDATDPASDQTLLYTDLRGRVEATHIQGGKWDAVGDFRLRLPADELAARGQLGGAESDLREAFFLRRGRKTDVGLGRIINREVDATTIDGLRVQHRLSRDFDIGAFAGLYPSPFSRSLDTDYRQGYAPQDMPVAAGAWGGYRTEKAWGNVGVAGILPRDDDPVDPEPTRAFVTANGYYRASGGLDIFHYLVADLAGRGGLQLMNGQVGVHWRRSAALVLEAAASHMSTYAIELYVRDYLEQPDVAPMPGRIQNNLFVARMASDELRGGFNYLLKKQRIDVFGQVRYRTRSTITSDNLPMELAELPADTQLEFSAGARQRKSFAKIDLSLNLLNITGDRTDTTAATLRARRAFKDDTIEVDLDATYLFYSDTCAFTGGVADEPNCTGTADGASLEVGGTILWRRDARWLFLADYHYQKNSATVVGLMGMTVADPNIDSHSLFGRVQYSF